MQLLLQNQNYLNSKFNQPLKVLEAQEKMQETINKQAIELAKAQAINQTYLAPAQ